MSRRQWTSGQLRRMPELRHFDRTDPFAQTYFSPLGIQWWNAQAHAFAASLAGLVLCVVIVPITAGLTTAVLFGITGSHAPTGVSWIMGFAVGVAWTAWTWRRAFRVHLAEHTPFIRAELRRRGVPICVHCGYEGGDLDHPQCPECGRVSHQPTPEPAFRRRPSLSHRDLRIAPELVHLPADDLALLQWAGIHGMASWGFLWCAIAGGILWSILYAMLVLMFGEGLGYWADRIGGRVIAWTALAMWILPFATFTIIAWRRFRAVAIRRMRIAVRRRGVPVCAWCGYTPGAIEITTCPECGGRHDD